MHAPGPWALIILVLLVVILFARPGKISNFMTDLGKGIKGFRSGISGKDEDEDAKSSEPAKQISKPADEASATRRDKSGVDH